MRDDIIPKYHFNLKKTFICPLRSPSFGLLGLKRIFQNGISRLQDILNSIKLIEATLPNDRLVYDLSEIEFQS
ncbi:MAG: hypothetical protein ACKO3R_01050 [bacterium]